MDCILCSRGAEEELVCTRCEAPVHFVCAFGAPVINTKLEKYFKKGQYSCPVCTICVNSDLVLQTVSANQRYLQQQNVRGDSPPLLRNEAEFSALSADVVDECEEEVEDNESVISGDGDHVPSPEALLRLQQSHMENDDVLTPENPVTRPVPTPEETSLTGLTEHVSFTYLPLAHIYVPRHILCAKWQKWHILGTYFVPGTYFFKSTYFGPGHLFFKNLFIGYSTL